METTSYTIMHRAAQYLATVAKSFIHAKEDDSHTNLGWNPEDGSLRTHPIDENSLCFVLHYPSFSLGWEDSSGQLDVLALNNMTHQEVLHWIQATASKLGLGNYAFDLHYELPFDALTPVYRYVMPTSEEIQRLIKIRGLGNAAILGAAKQLGMNLSPRIWPHHFDTGILIQLETPRAIGVGMGVPDKLVDDFYFYVSGYHGHNYIDNTSFPETKYGKKHSDWWKGYAMQLAETNLKEATQFLEEAIQYYRY